MTNNDVLVKHTAEKHARHLARLMRKRNHHALAVIDNSVVANFVGRRVYGNHDHLTIDEIWRIEEAFKRSLFPYLDGDISFPDQMRTEYLRGYDHLRDKSHDPLEALSFKWSKPESVIELTNNLEENLGEASSALKRFLRVCGEMRYAFHTLPTEAYAPAQVKARVPAIRQAIREVVSGLEKTDSASFSRSTPGSNDIDLFGTCYALSYLGNVDLVTADRHFIELQKVVYADNQRALRAEGISRPNYPITVILDTASRPWSEHAPGY